MREPKRRDWVDSQKRILRPLVAASLRNRTLGSSHRHVVNYRSLAKRGLLEQQWSMRPSLGRQGLWASGCPNTRHCPETAATTVGIQVESDGQAGPAPPFSGYTTSMQRLMNEQQRVAFSPLWLMR